MSDQQSSSTEQIQAEITVVADAEINEGAPVGFFVIGLIVNLVLIVAFFVWARRQWKKTSASDES